MKSRNTYVDIPLNNDDYYYDDYEYDYNSLGYGPPYYDHPEENRQSYSYSLPSLPSSSSSSSSSSSDQFIFPGRYVISQPHSSSTQYDRRLIIKLPDNTPPDTPLLGNDHTLG